MARTHYTKSDLIWIAEQYGVEVKKGWTKAKIEDEISDYIREDDEHEIDFLEELEALEEETGRGRGEDKASPRRIRAKHRKAEALRLRGRGLSYQEIADQLGYAHRSGARKAVVSELEKITAEPAEELIKIELARLDELHRAWFPLAVGYSGNGNGHSDNGDSGFLPDGWGDPSYRKPDFKACELVLKIMDRRAKLVGLDAPKRLEIETDWRETLREEGLDPEEVFEGLVGVFDKAYDEKREAEIPSDDEF